MNKYVFTVVIELKPELVQFLKERFPGAIEAQLAQLAQGGVNDVLTDICELNDELYHVEDPYSTCDSEVKEITI